VPLIVSGGLTAENVAAAIEAAGAPFAVDVASGVEAAPGVKDPRKLEGFFEAVNASASAGGPSAAATAQPQPAV
jgi:phosphoribosylanthranilate isomerase